MKLLRLNALPSNTQLEKTAVTIGNFDGVHLGHQAMIHQLKAVAKQQNLKTVVMIFEPQPLEFFKRTLMVGKSRVRPIWSPYCTRPVML